MSPSVRRSCLVALMGLALGAPAPARADLRVQARIGDAAPGPGPVQARLGEVVELTVVRLVGRGRREHVEPLPAGTRVRWLRIEPRLLHQDVEPPNPGVPVFSNSVLFGPDHGKWIGYDTLEYETTGLVAGPGVEVAGSTVRLRGAHPTRRDRDVHGGAGSVWIAAEALLPDGTRERSPDASVTDRFGMVSGVMRVSFRASDDYLGWLGTYFNVPFVFGSAGPPGRHQTDRYTGADCADVLVGGLRAAGQRSVWYASVSGIGRYADAVTDAYRMTADGTVQTLDGQPASLRWGTDVRPGDLLAIDYSDDEDGSLPRAWDHIGVLVRDAGPAGRADSVLGGADVLRHMGNLGLTDQPLTAQGPIRFRVWRWKRSIAPSAPTR